MSTINLSSCHKAGSRLVSVKVLPKIRPAPSVHPLRCSISCVLGETHKTRDNALYASDVSRKRRWRILCRSGTDFGNATVEDTEAFSGNGIPSNSYTTEPSGSYAALHDFCMSIPYGTALAVAGLVGYFTGYGLIGIFTHLSGLMVCLTSFMSLNVWKRGMKSTRYTLTTAGVCMGMMALSIRSTKMQIPKLACYITLGISGFMMLFLCYNIAAGGNPPKKH